MSDSPLLTELTHVVRKAAKLRAEVLITSESRLVEDLGIDSLDLVNVSLQVGDHFGVDIDPDVVPSFITMADIASYLAEHRGQGASAA